MSLDTGGQSGHVNFSALLKAGIGNELPATERITTRHSFVGKKGDLTVELHYGDFDDGHRSQAALYIFRNDPKGGVFVPLSVMWMYLERDSFHKMIPPLARTLYGFVTKFDMVRIMDALLDYIDDLRKSPPDPNIFKDRSLEAFQESCAAEGLEFFMDVGGKRVVG